MSYRLIYGTGYDVRIIKHAESGSGLINFFWTWFSSFSTYGTSGSRYEMRIPSGTMRVSPGTLDKLGPWRYWRHLA
ncbi:MAG TPA: hypothetical protein VJJ22_04040 [Candidatus Paceibacterota bacterium]